MGQGRAQADVESNLPIFVITTGNQRIVDEPKIDVQLTVHEPVAAGNATTITFDGFAGIESRGRSSQSFDKKSFGLETRDSTGENLNVSLLDLPPENDWVLYGPYADKSLIRNALTYELARSLGHYAPRVRMIELVIDTEYRGVYMLTEKIKRDANRVDIKKLTSSSLDLTGDYLFEINFDLESPQSGWTSRISYRPDFQTFSDYSFTSPKPEDISSNQADYIENWVHNLEDILSSPDFANPSTGYASKIDTDSWIDYILLNELSRDVDAYIGSTFLIKKSDDQGGRLHAGPVWDHNLSYGNSDYCGGQSIEGFAIEFEDVCQWRVAPIIFANVWQDPSFRRETAERWFSLRDHELGPDLFSKLDSLGDLLKVPARRNYERWPVLDTYLWPNAFVGKTYQDELQYLGNWISRRLDWLDQEFAKELQLQLPQSRSATISPNPSAEYSTPHIDFIKPLIANAEVQIIDMKGNVQGAFTAVASARHVPIPLALAKGVYVVTFQLAPTSEREYLRLVIQ